MESYESYTRSPPQVSRTSTRDRDDYRSSDPYRDRRRSPDRRRGGDRDRRRSRSPPHVDRYQPERLPRDDYYPARQREDGHRERRRSSPAPPSIDRYVPGQDPLPPPVLVNPLQDPMKLDFQVGFTWFAEWWRTEQRIKEDKERMRTGRAPQRARGEREMREERTNERSKIQTAYDQYKENLQKVQAQSFVRAHRGEDWFRERYVAEARVPFRQRLMHYRQGLFAQWEWDLNKGVFDAFTLEGIYKSESNGLGGILEKEEGEATAAAEVLGVGDLLPSKGGDIRDLAAQQPTLLIKTIAPTVTREKFEAFAKEHLGEGDGGFHHLSLSDPNPLKKCHRMGWILLNSDAGNGDLDLDARDTTSNGVEAHEQIQVDDGGAGEEKLARPTGVSERALEKINGKTIEDPERGNFTVHCGVHRPPEASRKKALWDLFSSPERISRDLELATRLVRRLDNQLGDNYFGVAKIEERVQHLADGGHLQPTTASKPTRHPDAMDEGEEGEEADDDEDEGAIDEDDHDDEELITRKKKLDLLVEYLRRVYNFCFFCVFESDSVHELQRKCPGGHLRRPRASLTSAAKEVAKASAQGEVFPLKKKSEGTKDGIEDGDAGEPESPAEEKKMLKPSARNTQQLQRAFNWVKTFEEKILQILEPENVNIRKLGGVPLVEGVDEELNKFVKQEDISKYRCKVPECTKLFKGVDFWRKHVEKRHTEWYERIRSEVELVNTYVLDPAHIAPSRSDANSNGHFPLGNSVPAGTPRGFQLNHQLSMSMGIGGGVPGLPMFTPQGQQMATAAGWASNAGMAGLHGVGPARHHGGGRGAISGYGGMRMAGPYARPDGRGRIPSLTGNRPPGITDGGAIGPQEAVQGRSLRSYEDLDADKGQDSAELDY